MFAVGLAIAFAPNYVVFVVLRFVQGAVREVRLYCEFNSNLIELMFESSFEYLMKLCIFVFVQFTFILFNCVRLSLGHYCNLVYVT